MTLIIEPTILFFILLCAGITCFITMSKIGLFIRQHPIVLSNDLIEDLLRCSACTGFWVGSIVSLYLELESFSLPLLNTLFGPTIYGFVSSLTSFILCAIFSILADKMPHLSST